jgi:hypothetical protein
VRTDADQTRSDDNVVIFTLKVKNADNSSGKLSCSVDRETGQPTIRPAG